MSVHRCIDEFFGALGRGEDAFDGFVTAVRALDEPEAEIASGLDALLADPESRHAHLWIVAAEARSSPELVEPLCRILETPGLKLSYESVVDALRPLCDERAVPALLTAFGYTLDFDPGRAMQSSILSLLAETDMAGCESFIRAAAEDDRDDNVRETARAILVEVYGDPLFGEGGR